MSTCMVSVQFFIFFVSLPAYVSIGSGVIETFHRKSSTPIEDETKVRFADVVRGKTGEECARYFLSTLMLANTYNVEISTEEGTDCYLGLYVIKFVFNDHLLISFRDG